MNSREEQEKPATDKSYSEKSNSSADPQKLFKWWKEPAHIIQTIGVFIGTIVALIYWCQLREMTRSNDINLEALTSVQRAFVNASITGENNVAIVNDKFGGKGTIIQIKLENTGNTSTRKATFHLNTSGGPWPMNEHWNFADIWPDSDHNHVHPTGIIGPRASVVLRTEPLPQKLLEGAASNPPTDFLYVWGWVKYRDRFRETPIHLTEFCYHLVPYVTTPELPGKSTFLIAFNSCGTHTCADEECEDYATKIREP